MSVRSHNIRMKMYTGRIVCCPLVSLIKFRKKDGTDRRQTVNIMLTTKRSQCHNNNNNNNFI